MNEVRKMKLKIFGLKRKKYSQERKSFEKKHENPFTGKKAELFLMEQKGFYPKVKE